MHSRENPTPTRSRPEHDEAITTAVADALDLGPLTKRDKLLMQRKLSKHGLGLRSMKANLELFFLAGFMKKAKSITSAFPHFNPIHHQKHAAVQHWFEQLAKQAHIATTPAPSISETNLQNPTKTLAADLLLIDVSLKEPGRDG